MTFPQCQLHETAIVTSFPEACPLGCANPLTRLTEYHDQMFWRGGHEDPAPAAAMGKVFDVCNGCVDGMLRDTDIKLLRRNKGLCDG